MANPGPASHLDPRQVKIEIRQMVLASLIKRMREGRVDLSPGQPPREVWSHADQSRLIESVLIRIPLPAFCVDVEDEEKWIVVDGWQRFEAVRDFVLPQDPDNGLLPQKLEFLKEFEGKGFTDLPRHVQRRIEETEMTLFMIEKGTPEAVRLNLYGRINPTRRVVEKEPGA
ncbi:MAG: DUF262 domain-containing protein [Magnetococcales bacterium]|nr:DUF262 domain-containing protein [Magnetococcales bacterium]